MIVDSRVGRPRRTEQRARAALADMRISFDLVVPVSEDGIQRIVWSEAAGGRRRFLVVGDDVILGSVVDALMRIGWDEPPVLGVLPAGAGCDFVRTFGIPQRLEDATAHLRGEATYRCDVGLVQGPWGDRYFLNAVQAGFGAAVSRRARKLRGLPREARRRLAGGSALVRFEPAEVRLETDRRTFEGGAMAAVLANGQFLAGGLNVAPKATVMDGRLDVQVIATSRREILTLTPRIARGIHLGDRAVWRTSSKAFRLTVDRPWPVEVDGRYVGDTPISGQVAEKRIDVKI
jgi:diacylglycerol kinase (ATP)